MKNLFGTDGIRSTINQGPLTEKNLRQLGHAIGHWATNNFEKPVKILVGYDTRSSCPTILHYLAQSLLQYCVELYDSGIVPTPVICKLVKEEDFDLGIIISASHNTAEYNGIKIVGKDQKLDSLAESAISTLYSQNSYSDINTTNQLQTYQQADQLYHIFISAWFAQDFLQSVKIVLDCAQGATYTLAPKIFAYCGADVITINAQPDGQNINENCGSTCPQTITKAVFVHQADWGIAFDGDGDRVLLVDKYGHVYDGDEILTILTHNPLFKKSAVVGTIMSNQGLGKYLQEKNKTFLRASVGDKQVYSMMQQYDALIGGEPSGHIIVKPFSYGGDGIFTALLCIETIIKQSITKPLLTKFTQISCHIPVNTEKNLTDDPIATIIKKYETAINPGRIVVRYSGTEPLLRIMAESENHQTGSTIVSNLKHELESILL